LFSIDHRCVYILPVHFKVLRCRTASASGERTPGSLIIQIPESGWHFRKPGGISISIGIQMIEETIFHHVIAMCVWQGKISLTQVPFACKIVFVTTGFENRRQGPFRSRQSAALSLEGNGCHSAAIWKATRLHGG